MTQPDNIQIAPAEGKLGVLIPGMGAVTTTFLAGLEAIKRGLGKPVGSLTQLGTVRLGKRTEGRSPAIKDFVPLANLEDLVVGTWDIFEDNAYEAAVNAGVLDMPLLEQLKEPLAATKADEGSIRPKLRQAPQRSERDDAWLENGLRRAGHGRHLQVQGKDWRFSTHDDLVRIHRGLSRTRACARYPEGLRMRAAEERP